VLGLTHVHLYRNLRYQVASSLGSFFFSFDLTASLARSGPGGPSPPPGFSGGSSESLSSSGSRRLLL
jgi:hypothetical protein